MSDTLPARGIILKRAVSRSKAAQLAELTSNLAILGLSVSVILDCDPKSLQNILQILKRVFLHRIPEDVRMFPRTSHLFEYPLFFRRTQVTRS
jgi:hypothetical protein